MTGADRIELGEYRGYHLFAMEDGRVRGYATREVAARRGDGLSAESFQVTGDTLEAVGERLRAVIDEEVRARRRPLPAPE